MPHRRASRCDAIHDEILLYVGTFATSFASSSARYGLGGLARWWSIAEMVKIPTSRNVRRDWFIGVAMWPLSFTTFVVLYVFWWLYSYSNMNFADFLCWTFVLSFPSWLSQAISLPFVRDCSTQTNHTHYHESVFCFSETISIVPLTCVTD